MGRDKGLVPFRGEPLVLRIYHRISSLSGQIIIITNTPENYQFTGLPLVKDVKPGIGALGGLLTALECTNTQAIGLTACDMPFVNENLFKMEFDLLSNEGWDVVIPSSREGLEPFHAVYRREICLEAVKKALENGERKMISWFSDVKVRVIPVEEVLLIDPSLNLFLNVNTQEELIAAEKIAQHEENLD